MNKADRASQARQMLDKRLAGLPPVSVFDPPRAGWIRAIRDALGLTAAQLGRRMGVSGATVSEIEVKEREGGIRLSTLRRAAEAMDCVVVYALVPRDSLDGIVTRRAEYVWADLQRQVDQTMLLEEQAAEWSEPARQKQLDEIIRSRNLWSDRKSVV